MNSAVYSSATRLRRESRIFGFSTRMACPATRQAIRRLRVRSALIGGYSPLFGSMLTGSAFHCAAAALMLRNQKLYACPVQDNPHGLRLCASTEEKELETIQCVKYDCFRERAVIELRR